MRPPSTVDRTEVEAGMRPDGPPRPYPATPTRDSDANACAPQFEATAGARRTPRAAGAARVAAQLVVESVRVLVWTSVLAVRLAALALIRRRPRTPEIAGEALRRYLLRMGPLYTKAGQVLATQSGLIPHETAQRFRSFLSELEPMSPRALRRTLRRRWDDPASSPFASFDLTPIAVGSVAQVHHAVLSDGRAVAVKIVKRGVRERLDASCLVVSFLLGVAHVLLPAVRRLELRDQFRELSPLLSRQGDLRVEARSQAAVAANFGNHPYLRVPAVLESLSDVDVLVMDFVTGTKGQDIDQAADLPRAVLASRLQEVFSCMAYFHGLFHVDPHPGNVLLGPQGEVTLLDFGLVGQLSEDEKWNLASFYYACVRGQWNLAVDRFERTFVARPRPVHEDYARELTVILRKHFEEERSRWSTMGFFGDSARLLHRHGRRMSSRLAMLALAFLTGEGFVSAVDPNLDVWANARKFTDRFSPYMSEEIKDHFTKRLGSQIPRSLAMRQRAADHLIAPTHLDRFVLPSAFPLAIASARGSRLTDLDGNSYIDLSCGYGPHILGYAHPVVVRATRAALEAGAVNAIGNLPEVELATLISTAFGPDSRTILANSGTEAVIMALRLARALTGRDRVAKFEGHYHGFSDPATVSSWFRYRGPAERPEPVANSAGAERAVTEKTLVLQYGSAQSLRRLEQHAHDVAAVVIEPMPAALAQFDAPFLAQLRRVCDDRGIVLVFDEVVSGFRVAYGGAQHLAGVRPDLTCLGKIVGGGLPGGAVVGPARFTETARTTGDPFLDVETRAFVGGTMSGNSVTAAAGAATVRHLRDHPDIYRHLHALTETLRERLAAAATAEGVPCVVTANASIFSLTFDHSRPRTVRDRLAGTNLKANLALAYYLRCRGVYMPELHTMMLNAAHDDADVDTVAKAFQASLRDMTDDGLFTC